MAGQRNVEDITQKERRILRLLCQDAVARARLANVLHGYRWRDLSHCIVFEIVSNLQHLTSERLRAVLPARLANAGFPDFPWEDLYLPCDVSAGEAETLIQRLEAAGD